MSSMTATAVRTRRIPLMPGRGQVSWFEILLLLICCVLVVSGIATGLQDVLLLSFLFGGLALAWNIAGGYAGLISFGHSAFFGVGAYTSTILLLRYGVTPWIGIWIGALLAAVLGSVLALICARLRGPFFILSTLAFAEVVRIGALNWSSLTGGPEGLSIMPAPNLAGMVFASKTTYAALMLGYLVLVYAAIRDNEDAAGAAGVNPLLGRTAALALSAGLTGVGGSLFAQYFLYLDPTYVISPELSFQFALLPAVGGLGTAIGPVLGSFLITPLSELLRSYLGNSAAGLHLVIYSFGLIVVMLYFPAGLAGALNRLTRQRPLP
jgi:branched-chain amino acid transport system permease protein